MKNPFSTENPSLRNSSSKGFTLMETVIAIGVLAVLLTGFIAVFTPAAQGIKRSINSQQADRLATTLERELVTLRSGQNNGTAATGFEKAFNWIKAAHSPSEAIFVYQYRGDPSNLRTDGTPTPVPSIDGQPGKGYTVQSVARRASETTEFQADLKAIVGAIFYVKPTQLIYKPDPDDSTKTILELGTIGTIENSKDKTPANAASDYTDAVIAFSAEFYSVPSKAESYLIGANKAQFEKRFNNAKRPVFSRNLAVRR